MLQHGMPGWRGALAAMTVAVALSRVAPVATAAGAAEGPLSLPDRIPAPTTVSRENGVLVSDFDLGDIEYKGKSGRSYRGPVRGVLAVPEHARRAPLVVFTHLRSSGCTDDTFAYPCPEGTSERRYDRGQRYLAEAMARNGYAVLVPDLAPVFIAPGSTIADYDQQDSWVRTVTAQRDRLVTAVRKGDRAFGVDLSGAVDLRRVAVAGHSRSGLFIAELVRRWQPQPTPVASVFFLGPFLATQASLPRPAEAVASDNHWGELPPGVPLLGLVPGADGDARTQPGNQLLAHYLGQRFTRPAAVATADGYGHNFFNRALSAVNDDDRRGCEGCPDAAAHERLLTRLFGQWLDTTLRGLPAPDLPTRRWDPVPQDVAGVPGRWLVATTGHKAVLLDPIDHRLVDTAERLVTAVDGAELLSCRTYPVMVPDESAPDRCPMDVPDGVPGLSFSYVLTARWSERGAVRLEVPANTKRVRSLVLHLMPHVLPEGARGIPVRVAVTDEKVQRAEVTISADDPAVRRLTPPYTVNTVRLPMSEFVGVNPDRLTAVELGSAGQPGGIALRGVEFAQR